MEVSLKGIFSVRTVAFGILILLGALIGVLLVKNSEYRDRLVGAEQCEARLQEQIEVLEDSLTQCEKQLQDKPGLNAYHMNRLQKKGLEDPRRALIDDLIGHAELIPYEGVLGGTMAFWRDQTWVLTGKWALAYFEDGHYGGYMLLEYHVSDAGEISWEVVASYLI